MILGWATPRQPFKCQKLSFKARKGLNCAWREARSIRRLIMSVGNYTTRDVKILAVGVENIMQTYLDEYKIHVVKHDKDIQKVIKKAKALKLGKPKGK